MQVYTQQHTSALLSTVIWAIIQNGKACHPNFPCCPALPLCHSILDIVSWYDWLICQEETIHISSSRAETEKTVFAQWCHLKYAGTVDVYWKVKHCINKGWRYFRSAANQNIELLSICHPISHFFIFPGNKVIHWITLALCKSGKKKKGKAESHTTLIHISKCRTWPLRDSKLIWQNQKN